MTSPLQHPREGTSNTVRAQLAQVEPRSLRTYTPTQAVLAKSAGVYHWTPEGRRLYDYSSGVLVANLGHNPRAWMQRFCKHMGWNPADYAGNGAGGNFFPALPMTAYNAATPVEIEATRHLIELLGSRPGGKR